MNISGKTKVVAIFGDPIGHTLSPAMHNAAFAASGLDFIYVPFNVKPDSLGDAIKGIRAMGFAGANITVPHKEAVIKYLDAVDAEAKLVGAVNTIVNRGGVLSGYNTDGRGFVRAAAEGVGFEPSGKRVFICGAGGAARGVGFALAAAGAKEIIFSDIDAVRRDRLVADINAAYPGTAVSGGADAGTIRDADLAVNATPRGMKASDGSPMPDGSFRAGQAFADLVYNPPKTNAMDAAQAAGAKVMNGLGMLLWQGALAYELWTGAAPDMSAMKEAVKHF